MFGRLLSRFRRAPKGYVPRHSPVARVAPPPPPPPVAAPPPPVTPARATEEAATPRSEPTEAAPKIHLVMADGTVVDPSENLVVRARMRYYAANLLEGRKPSDVV